MSKDRLRVAIVGAETLLGKEIESVLADRTKASVVSFAASGEGNFGEAEGAAVFVEPLDARTVAGVGALLAAGSAEGAQKAYSLAKAAGGKPLLIDCSGHLDSQPEARIISPLVLDAEPSPSWLLEIAQPAASVLALTLTRLARYRALKQVVAHVFEPASEQGKRGVTELHAQTAGLLAFKPLAKTLFDGQLSFNLLAQYGEESSANLAVVEGRIDRHVASILSTARGGGKIPMPSVRVVGAPVFHGYTFSLWAEFETNVQAQDVAEALASAQIEIRGPGEEAPNGVGAAGQSGLIAGDIRIDRNNSRAAWLWMAADNLRLIADGAADLVSKMEEAGR